MKTKIMLCLVVSILILTTNHQAFAEEKLLKIAFPSWPPWKITALNSFEGIDAKIINKVAKRIRIKIEFKECPWKRCIEMIKEGDADIITSFAKNFEREKFTYYIEPFYNINTLVFYGRKGKVSIIQKYEDLYNIEIGVVKGSVYFEPFDSDLKIDKQKINFDIQLLKMLESGRIDAFLGSEITYDYLIIKEGFQGKFEKASFIVETEVKSYIAMSKKSKFVKMIPQISAAIKEIVENDGIEKLVNEYFEELRSK